MIDQSRTLGSVSNSQFHGLSNSEYCRAGESWWLPSNLFFISFFFFAMPCYLFRYALLYYESSQAASDPNAPTEFQYCACADPTAEHVYCLTTTLPRMYFGRLSVFLLFFCLVKLLHMATHVIAPVVIFVSQFTHWIDVLCSTVKPTLHSASYSPFRFICLFRRNRLFLRRPWIWFSQYIGQSVMKESSAQRYKTFFNEF